MTRVLRGNDVPCNRAVIGFSRAILSKKKGDSNKSKHEEQMGDIADMIAAKYGGGNSSKNKKRAGKKNKGKENSSVWLCISGGWLANCVV